MTRFGQLYLMGNRQIFSLLLLWRYIKPVLTYILSKHSYIQPCWGIKNNDKRNISKKGKKTEIKLGIGFGLWKWYFCFVFPFFLHIWVQMSVFMSCQLCLRDRRRETLQVHESTSNTNVCLWISPVSVTQSQTANISQMHRQMSTLSSYIMIW